MGIQKGWYAISFETIGPSCKFPIAADHSGDYEYRLSVSNKMHQCYQLTPDPAPPVKKGKPSWQKMLMSGKSVDTSAAPPRTSSGHYNVHIELENPADTEILSLLRVFGKAKLGDEWYPLTAVRSSETEVVFKLDVSHEGVLQLPNPDGGADWKDVMKKRIQAFTQALQLQLRSPSWITVTLLSDEVHNFKIWFSEDDEEKKKESEEEEEGSALGMIVTVIVFAFVILIGVMIYFFKGADDVKYHRIDRQNEEDFEIGDHDSDEGDGVGVEMEEMDA